ncbi:MAG: MBL fold metallo-hydrolase [Syntrophomonadaceae bacterium]|nr:MBL fold metallo-hydrolase [Syntrophomonadaceae bacterium]
MKKLYPHISITEGACTFPWCNMLLIEDELNALVDCSPAPEPMEQLKDVRIDAFYMTHGHCDHVSECFQYYPGAEMLMHPLDIELAASPELQLMQLGFDIYPIPDIRAIYLDAAWYSPCTATGTLQDGQRLSTGDVDIDVVHLPGHTPGHCGFAFPQHGMLFTGDIGLDKFGIWCGDTQSQVGDCIRSIHRIGELQPDVIVSSHWSIIDKNIPRRLHDYENIIYQREEAIAKHLRRGRHTIIEIAEEKPIYGKFNEPWVELYRMHERMMILKHLEYMVEKGEVEQDQDIYRLK